MIWATGSDKRSSLLRHIITAVTEFFSTGPCGGGGGGLGLENLEDDEDWKPNQRMETIVGIRHSY
jgi:hypothetical protein